MKTAIVIGCDGQDGRIACDLLRQKQYQVFGVGRNGPVDITQKQQVLDFIRQVNPDEIYYLAACHQSSQDQFPDESRLLKESQALNVEGMLYCCEGMRKYAPQAKLFYAASCLIYEGSAAHIQDEETPFSPQSIYAMTKLNGLLLCRHYRSHYGLFASCGILYNHDSVFRKGNFISTKIIKAALDIKNGKQDSLVLGSLNAEADWGYAPDYVHAMHLILNAERPDDFIIATGKKHRVQEWVEIVFGALDLDWKKYVREDAAVTTRKNKTLIGNPQKLMQTTGWRPSVDFPEMVKLLLSAHEASYARL